MATERCQLIRWTWCAPIKAPSANFLTSYVGRWANFTSKKWIQGTFFLSRRYGVAWMTIKASPCALGRFLEGRFFLSLMISQPFALASTKLWETSSNWFLLLLSEKNQHMKDVSPTCFRNVTAATGPARDTMVTLWKTTFEVWATSTTWASWPWKTAEGCATLPWVVTSSSSSQILMKASVPSSTGLVRRDK